MLNISSIKLEVEFLTEVLLDVFDVSEITEAEVVDLVRKIQTMTLHIQSLHNFRVVVTGDVEVAWHLVNEYEATKFTTLLIFEPLNCLIKHFLRLSLTRL